MLSYRIYNQIYTKLNTVSTISLLAKRAFGHSINILKDENFLNTYYDNTSVLKESELDTDEFRTRLESWASPHMFTGVKMRKNGDWFASFGNTLDGPFETCVAAAKRWDDLCYSMEKDVRKLNFPEKYWMRGVSLPNLNYYVPGASKESVDWVPPTAKKAQNYDIEPIKGKCLSLEETMQILKGEGAMNIRVLNMRNHSSMASHMLFVTGISINHEKRIGDTIVHYLRKRQLKNIPIRVTDRDESEWMVVDGESVITNIFSPRYRMARELEDQWELMRPGKTRYENWTNEQLQERFGFVEEKMEAMSLDNIVQSFQQSVETEFQNASQFLINESVVDDLKEEISNEVKTVDDIQVEDELDSGEYQTNEYYLTKDDLEKMMNDDGTITIDGQRLKIEEIVDVDESEVKDADVPFLEVKEEPKGIDKKKRKEKLKNNNRKTR